MLVTAYDATPTDLYQAALGRGHSTDGQIPIAI